MWPRARLKHFLAATAVFVIGSFCIAPEANGRSYAAAAESKFEISFPSAVRSAPITGRVLPLSPGTTMSSPDFKPTIGTTSSFPFSAPTPTR